MSILHNIHLAVIRSGKSAGRIIIDILLLIALFGAVCAFTNWAAHYCPIFLIC